MILLADAIAEGIRQGFRELHKRYCFRRDKAALKRQAVKVRNQPSYDIDYPKEAVALASLAIKLLEDYEICLKGETPNHVE